MISPDLLIRHREALLRDKIASGNLTDGELQGQRILLTGTSGQLGLWMLATLLQAGAEVTAIRHKTHLNSTHSRLHWLDADLSVPGALSAPLPPIVVSCAPLPMLVPHLPALRAAGVKRIIAFGSTSMHCKKQSPDAEERAAAQALQTSEDALLDFGHKTGAVVTIFRPTLIYGIGLDLNVCAVEAFLRRWRLFPVAAPGRGLRQPVHVEDLTQAAIAALKQPEATGGKAYDLSGGEALRYTQFVRRIAQYSGIVGGPIPVPALPWMMDMAGRLLCKPRLHGGIAQRMNHDLAFGHAAAARDFGYAPRGFLRDQPRGIPAFWPRTAK